MATSPAWHPTPALGRAVLIGALGLAAAVSLGSPSVVVLASPLVLAGVLALLRRPASQPPTGSVTARLDLRTLHEGQGSVSRLSLQDTVAVDVEHVTRAMHPAPYVAFHPPSGVVGGLLGPGRAVPEVEVGPRRWGRRVLGAELVGLTSAWAGYRLGPVAVEGTPTRVLPGVLAFDSRAQAPQPAGLVGVHRSRRSGAGTELADIRPFRTGDRLRRINWRVSARTGELHVVTSPAEQDTGVLLVVDALADHGRSDGVDGSASSLDLTVRAAVALAAYYLGAGDRVGMRVVGGDGGLVAPGSGGRHLRVLQDTVAGLRAGSLPDGISDRIQLRVRGGSLVLVLSPMLDPAIVTATASLARRGLPVVVIDTLPVDARPEVPDGVSPRLADLAWRLRRLEREQVLLALTGLGCPVVTWHGSGSVDLVLARLGRRRGPAGAA